MSARMLLIAFIVLCKTQFSQALNAEDAHLIIQQQAPHLLGDGSQLVSVYYFGHSHDLSVVGLERVGDDYLPIRWLVVFKHNAVLGWYYPCDEFPVRFNDGHLMFPKGSKVEDIYMLPSPPEMMTIESRIIPFIPLRDQGETSSLN